jgi:hypothetical protein
LEKENMVRCVPAVPQAPAPQAVPVVHLVPHPIAHPVGIKQDKYQIRNALSEERVKEAADNV